MESVKMPDLEECAGKTETKLETGSSESSTVDLIKSREGIRADEDVAYYPRGFGPFFSTVGLTFVVLMIALDNYIIGTDPFYLSIFTD